MGFDQVEQFKLINENMRQLSLLKNFTFVSRLQCIQASVDSHLEEVPEEIVQHQDLFLSRLRKR